MHSNVIKIDNIYVSPNDLAWGFSFSINYLKFMSTAMILPLNLWKYFFFVDGDNLYKLQSNRLARL